MLFTERSPIKATSCMTISGGKPNNSGTWSSVCSVYLSWKYTQKPRINRQNRLTEDHVPWICLPQGDLPAVHSCCIYRSSALPVGPLGGLPSLLLTTGGSRMHLEGRAPNLSSVGWWEVAGFLPRHWLYEWFSSADICVLVAFSGGRTKQHVVIGFGELAAVD